MKKNFLLALLVGSISALAVEIKPDWQIVLTDQADASVRYSGKVLSEQLGKSFGKATQVIAEKNWDGKAPAIFLGWSSNKKNLQAPSDRKWSNEEWNIREVTPQLVQISGSSQRGVFYGTLEFLERFAGYRAYAVDLEYIDSKKSLTLPEKLNLTGKPFFPFRSGSFGVYSNNPFWSHNRTYILPQADFGWYTITGLPRGVHTFYFYSKDFDRDEYFSLNENGVRQKAVGPHGPGQICMSNPGARQAVLKKLLAVIAEERAEIDKTRPGTGYPEIYSLSVNDTPAYCHCSGCKALYKKYGAISGAQLEFLNAIAEELVKVYPDVYILGEAYEHFAEPPKNIKAHNNVIIRIAQLGKEFSLVGNRDCLLPLTHPANKRAFEQIQNWLPIASKLAVWEYGKIYVEALSLPHTTVRAHASNLKYFAKNGVISAYLEAEFTEGGHIAMINFLDLEHYVNMRMQIDPEQDVELLIEDFMHKYYGPAAKHMSLLLSYLEKRMAEDPMGISGASFKNRKYLDKALIMTAHKFLTDAENAVKNNPVYLARVRQERLPFDSLIINQTDLKLLKDQGGPLNRAMIVKRWKAAADAAVMKYCFDKYYRPGNTRSALLKKNQTRYEEYLTPIKLPEFLKNVPITVDCTTRDFNTQGVRFTVVADADAAGGSAAKYDKDHKQPFELGLYDNKTRKTISRQVFSLPPQDEKYHWCKFSNVLITSTLRMWGHYTWSLSPIFLQRFYDPRNPLQRYDIYISYKLEGPAYVKNSTKANACYMDRIIITPANAKIKIPQSNAQVIEPPEFLRHKLAIADYTVANFKSQHKLCKVVADKDAVTGKAVCYDGKNHEKPFELGVYDNKIRKTLQRLTISDPPQDEKYHWYKLSNIKLGPKVRMWGHSHWYLTPIMLSEAYDAKAPNRICDIYISSKLQGPAYVKNSTKTNACFIDRIIITPADPTVKVK